MAELSDAALVESSRNGDTEAFAELWRRHSAAGRTVARSFTDADADDLVAEAYERILQAVKQGRGPTAGFRPYLFTTIRNVATSVGRSRRETPIDDATILVDPSSTEAASMEALDHSLTAQAFRSLPQRWQEVLWYCEVEQMAPATVAPLLGMSANSVAALAYRAREGLRQAWIQAHITSNPEGSDCRWTTERLGAYSRGGLGKRETARLEKHLTECLKCSLVAAEADNVGSRLALVLLPLLLGISGAAAYASTLHGATASAAAGAAGTGGAQSKPTSSIRSIARSGRLATGAAIASVLVVAGVAGAVMLGTRTLPTGSPPSIDAAAPGPVAPKVTATAPDPAAPTPTVPPALPPAQPPAPPSGEPAPQSPISATPPRVVATPPSVAVPPQPAVPPAPTTPVPPPAAPVLTTSLAPGYATSASSVLLDGTGLPGSTIQAYATPKAGAMTVAAFTSSSAPTPSASPVGTATVDAAGHWQLAADISALADGVWELTATQTAAGQTSPASSAVELTIDRTALPPVVTTVDTGTDPSLRLAPVLTGQAEPGAAVSVFSNGSLVATTTADGSGQWSVPELITLPSSYSLTVRQTDVLGNTSVDSDPIAGTGDVAAVVAAGAPGTVTIGVHGSPGRQVQVWADGAATGHILTLDASGDAAATYIWSSGDHRIGVTYLVGSRHGILSDVPVTLP